MCVPLDFNKVICLTTSKTFLESLGQGWLLSRVRLPVLSLQGQNAGIHLFHVYQNIQVASQWFVIRSLEKQKLVSW